MPILEVEIASWFQIPAGQMTGLFTNSAVRWPHYALVRVPLHCLSWAKTRLREGIACLTLRNTPKLDSLPLTMRR